jgi:hypothetical protein
MLDFFLLFQNSVVFLKVLYGNKDTLIDQRQIKILSDFKNILDLAYLEINGSTPILVLWSTLIITPIVKLK